MCTHQSTHPPTHPTPGTDVDSREIAEAGVSRGFPHSCIAIEPKCHPAYRVGESNPFRVRLKLRGADGRPTLAKYPTKQSLLLPLAAAIPGTELRRALQAAKAEQREAFAKQEREAAKAAKSAPSQKTAVKDKKSGKGKK